MAAKKSIAEILDEIPDSSPYGIEADEINYMLKNITNVQQLMALQIDNADEVLSSINSVISQINRISRGYVLDVIQNTPAVMRGDIFI